MFYPKDKTPVFTEQLLNYSANQEEVKRYDVKIIGVNIGQVK